MNVKELRLRMGITQEELADKTKIPRSRIAKWEQGKGSPKSEDEKTLSAFFTAPIEEVHKNREEVTTEENKAATGKRKPDNDVVYSLSESNRIIAESNKALAESNRLLAKSNLELVEKVKGTVNVEAEKQISVQTILPGLQELLIELGLGTLWENRSLGQTILNKRLFGQQEKKSSKGIRDGSGK